MASQKGCAWVISVDMGYGHQRAAYPLKDIAYERIITANNDKIISFDEKRFWDNSRNFYEFISRLKQTPFIGKKAFSLFDKTQAIPRFFPFRDLTKKDILVFLLKRSIKKGLCKSLIDYVKKKDLPFITTHPIPALAAHYLGIKNIFCVVTDTDIARGWVIDKPKENTITYLAPAIHTAVRLREYGISENKIILTGFPLPKENIGAKEKKILKEDLGKRLPNLDPNKSFISKYNELVKKDLGKNLKEKSDHPLTITYMVGGAGAEKDIGVRIIKSLADKIAKNQIIINLSAGTRLDVLSYYTAQLDTLGMKQHIGKNINIVFSLEKKGYFESLNKMLRKTDILWTKPSELSFYTALGIPIIIAPPIGAHENYNLEWLRDMGSGFIQENPDFVDHWLFYWLEQGKLAEAAWHGYTKAPIMGTYEIEKLVKNTCGIKCNVDS